MTSQNANDRCLSHGLGSDPRGMLESMCVEGPVSHMVHQPSGDVGCISCSQEFPSRSQGPPCACPLRQHICGLLHKSPGGFAVMSTLQTGVPNPPVVPREVVVSSSSLHSGDPQYKSRHPVETGAEARGMEASPRGGGADMEGVRPSTSGSACFSRDVSLSTLVLPHTSSSSRTGRDGAEVAEASFGVLARSVHYRANPVYFGGLCGGHKRLPHAFGWNIIGERPPGISFPTWYFDAEACSSHHGADMGSGYCPARPFPASLRAFRGGACQIFYLKSVVPPCYLIS